MVTLLAALEAGVVTARDRITCEGRYEYANHIYRCWNKAGHGPCDLHRALRESCDVYFYDIARRTGIDAIARMARRLGLGQTYDCGIALQRAGVVPDADWKRMRLGRPWLGGETVLAGIGQGYVLTTPLQLAVMTARLATGRSISPTLVRRQDENVAGFPALPDLRPEWLDAIRRAMHAVVHEDGGTGSSARLEDANVRMAGKTGTSQVSRASTMKSQSELRWEERDHALFVAYAPANAPRYAIAAIVEHAGSGGQVAAPLVRDVMADLIKRDPGSRPAYKVTERGRG
jgi:penicillin-binding protein 2